MEGLDIRTLIFTNVLLGLFLGSGSLLFARIHPFFLGFKALGYSYLLFSFGFALLGLRHYIPDFISIIIANLAIVAAFSLLIMGVLKFLKHDNSAFKKMAIFMLLIMLVAFVYFTYFYVNINARIITISTIMAIFSLFVCVKVLTKHNNLIATYSRVLVFSFLFAAVVFLLRIYFTLHEATLNNFMDAGIIHAFSLIALLLISITSCFALTLSASQQLTNKLAIQVTIDPLTTIYNRRAFDELALNVVSRAQRENKPLSVILIDVDYFKQINEKFGHQLCNKLLRECSARLKGCLRQYDILARYEDEAFVLLLPDTNAETAILIAEKLRYSVLYPEFNIHKDGRLNVSASFGVATNKGEHIHWLQLLALAEQALFHAKNSGGNGVKLHSASVHRLPTLEKHQ
jgi:diguanylate cyclase (GGDEF)-like protein